MDRGYIDFERLHKIHPVRAFFVTRAKKNTQMTRRFSHIVDKSTGIQCDQTVVLTNDDSRTSYPEPFRRVRYYDDELDKRFVFSTNSMSLSARIIADLYRSRWRRQVELFFQMDQAAFANQDFYGVSENAVKSQIWITVSILLVAILKKKLGLSQSLYQILQIFCLTQFGKTPIFSMFERKIGNFQNTPFHNQPTLFDLWLDTSEFCTDYNARLTIIFLLSRRWV